MSAIISALASAGNVVGGFVAEGAKYLREYGRIGVRAAANLFNIFSDPSKGILASIAIVKLTELVTIDINAIMAMLDNIAVSLERFDADTIFPAVSIDVSRYVNEANANLRLNECGTPPNPVTDPGGALAWAGCNISNGFILVARGLYIVGSIIRDAILYAGRFILVNILNVFAKMLSYFIRYIAKPIILAILSTANFVSNKIRWAACEYLKFSHILIMFRTGYELFRRGRSGLGRIFIYSFGSGVLATAAISMLVPECYAGAPSSPPPPPPGAAMWIPPSLYMISQYTPPFISISVNNVQKTITATIYERVSEGAGLL